MTDDDILDLIELMLAECRSDQSNSSLDDRRQRTSECLESIFATLTDYLRKKSV